VRRGTDRLTTKAVEAFVKQALTGSATVTKLFDGSGLYITMTKAGSAVWRIKYRIGGADRTFSLGAFREVSLAQARFERAEVRKLVRGGFDPVARRREQRAANAVATETSFKAASEAWLEKRRPQWSAIHYATTRRALERDVWPHIGSVPTAGITTPMIANVIERVVRREANETPRKILLSIRRVIALAATRDATVDVRVADAVSEVLVAVKPYKPRPALLTFGELGAVLRESDVANLSPPVRMALRLAAFSGQRVANVVAATWSQFVDLEGGEPLWIIPRASMKVQRGRPFDHVVPLGRGFAAELLLWRELSGRRSVFLFPSPTGNGEHITPESLPKVYKQTLNLGDKHSPHGWRSSLATLAKDVGGFDRTVVELHLDHVGDVKIVRTYDRGQRREQRRALVDWWTNALMSAERGQEPPASTQTNVLSFPATSGSTEATA
jgi:integrase